MYLVHLTLTVLLVNVIYAPMLLTVHLDLLNPSPNDLIAPLSWDTGDYLYLSNVDDHVHCHTAVQKWRLRVTLRIPPHLFRGVQVHCKRRCTARARLQGAPPCPGLIILPTCHVR